MRNLVLIAASTLLFALVSLPQSATSSSDAVVPSKRLARLEAKVKRLQRDVTRFARASVSATAAVNLRVGIAESRIMRVEGLELEKKVGIGTVSNVSERQYATLLSSCVSGIAVGAHFSAARPLEVVSSKPSVTNGAWELKVYNPYTGSTLTSMNAECLKVE